jgi:protein-S-isoprenylcysteine O-methyltransferase Ste14
VARAGIIDMQWDNPNAMREEPISAPVARQLATTGSRLFRWRSYMPLALLPLFLLSVTATSAPTSFRWEVSCFTIALLGLLLRAFVIGTAPDGASARGTRQPSADTLATTGAYSIVRHPLYLANTVIAAGCALLSGTWFLPVIVVLLSFIYHERIAAREEAFLRDTFGSQFEVWAQEVPAMIPRVGRYQRPGGHFRIRKVIMQECHGLFAIGAAFFVLDTLEDSIRARMFQIDQRWLTVFAVTAVPFLIVVLWKKRRR